MRKILLLTIPMLAACNTTGAPTVADYNGRIVKIQFHDVPLGSNYKASPIYLKAVETCMLDGRNDASYQGVRSLGQYAGEHTFLCI